MNLVQVMKNVEFNLIKKLSFGSQLRSFEACFQGTSHF